MLKDTFQRTVYLVSGGIVALYRATDGYKMYLASGGIFVAAVINFVEGQHLTAFKLACEALGFFGAKSALLKLDGEKLTRILEIVSQVHEAQIAEQIDPLFPEGLSREDATRMIAD